MSMLLFIYNANSGKLNKLFNVGHKLLSPSTYKCNLCALTFDTFTENKSWKTFRENSSIDLQFFHIDEFEKTYPNKTFQYPIVLKKEAGQLSEFLSSQKIEAIENAEQLIHLIKSKIELDYK